MKGSSRSGKDASRGLSGDEIRAIYEKYGHLIHRRCRTLLRDEAAADDALQEVFINLIKYGQGFRGAEAKLLWLYKVADRCCYRHLDRGRRLPLPAGGPDDLGEPKAANDEPHNYSEDRLQDRYMVMATLGALDAEERDLAVMAFVEERDQGEIAQILGFSRQTINKRLKRLRTRAAELLAASR